jgi:phosphoribosylformimino-5-aminoimidazole carboxamide ribotide isomerase
MQVWAAIDILDGSVVTLVQGKPSHKTVWSDTPMGFARRWQKEGADGLHIVDLDAAFERGSNRETVTEIIRDSEVPVQVGGGIRSVDAVREWLVAGAERVVLGTIAYREPRALDELLRQYGPGKIVVAADYKDGRVMSKGWTQSQQMGVLDAVRSFEKKGVAYVLATAVGQDGTGNGPDITTVRRLCAESGMRILASGGIRNPEDLAELEGAGAHAAIVGRALYEETVRISELGGRQ